MFCSIRFHHSSGWTTSDCRMDTRCSHNHTESKMSTQKAGADTLYIVISPAEWSCSEHSLRWQIFCPSPHCRDCSPPGGQTWSRSWRLGRSGERPVAAVAVVAVVVAAAVAVGNGRRSAAADGRPRTSGPKPATTHQELHTILYTRAASAKLNWNHCWYWTEFVEHGSLAPHRE